MGGLIVTQREVAPMKPGTAMEEQLQLKGIGRLLAGFGYRYGSEVQQFLQQQGEALESNNVTTMETSR